MKMKVRAALSLLILGLSTVAWAEVPPPPVNQFLGIPDTVFSTLTTEDCRTCHGPTPPAGIPVDTTPLPNRHHILVEQNVIIPEGTAAPNGVPGEPYECLSCHTITQDANGDFVLAQNFRDCFNCHQPLTDAAGNVIGTVHHATAAAQNGNCVACHGDLVQNGVMDADGDGVLNAVEADTGWIPTYAPSLVTPAPGTSTNTNPGANGEGSCVFCHAPGTATIPITVDVRSNSETHHSTGFGLDNSKCLWCHTTIDGGRQIRQCEYCHGIPSLHNIQVESPDADSVITPGEEMPYYGHIGAQEDCWGCHGFTSPPAVQAASFAPNMGATVPAISEISATSVPAGKQTSLTLNGSAFTNQLKSPMTGEMIQYASKVVLTDENGNALTLDPVSLSQGSMEVLLPALDPGNYRLVADKNGRKSNPKVVTVTPEMSIYSVECSNGTVTIKGSGFGPYLEAQGAGMAVDGTGKVTKRRRVQTIAETARIASWTDTQVVAKFSSCMDQVEVAGLFDGAAASVKATDPVQSKKDDRLARLLELLSKYRRR